MSMKYADLEDQLALFSSFRTSKAKEQKQLVQNEVYQFSASLDPRMGYHLIADGATIYYRTDGTDPTVLPADGVTGAGNPVLNGERFLLTAPDADTSGSLKVITSGSNVIVTLVENSDTKF